MSLLKELENSIQELFEQLLEAWQAQAHNLRHYMQGAHHYWIMIGLEGAQDQRNKRIKPSHHLLELLFSLLQKATILIYYDILVLQSLLEAL